MTHEQLDQQYVDSGVFTRDEINELQGEFQNTLSNLNQTQENAKQFLKQKMGKIKYFFWSISPDATWTTLGQDNHINKAKQYGFNGGKVN